MTTPPVGRGRGPSATTARTVAQAKINLFLRVLAREDTGYHQLETLFCRLTLGDDVTVRVDARGRSLDATGDAVPSSGLGPVEQNLAWRAAEAFAASTGWPNDWAIEIRKRIPVGGGLGGGSADAGAVLRCLNALAPAPLGRDALLGLAASLGADVPFLSLDAPLALAWGRGDRMILLPALAPRDVALACFPFGVPTPAAYGWLDETRSAHPSGVGTFELAGLADWASVARLAHNDFEPVVGRRFAAISNVLETWRAAACLRRDPHVITLLAGSGATVFAIADTLESDVDRMLDPSVRVVRARTADRVVAVEASG